MDSSLSKVCHTFEGILSENNVFNEHWHNEYFFEFLDRENDSQGKTLNWRLKERMKTAAVALCLCLNIGTDPPDIIKPQTSAKRECWIEPVQNVPKQKILESIGNALQIQYERLQPKIKYKQCLDPTAEDLRKVCVNLRKGVKNERLLFHYNGHGVPRPTKNGEIWLFGRNYSHYFPIGIQEVQEWLGGPTIYVLDCSAAGVLIPQLIDIQNLPQFPVDSIDCNIKYEDRNSVDISCSQSTTSSSLLNPETIIYSQQVDGPTIILAACKANELLPTNPLYPADIFTSCLTTPISIALRWLVLQNPYSLGDVNLELSENIPGKEGDRKTPKGELYWIFTAITDTIAWSSLPSLTFQKIFRQDMLKASLFRNFLLARRIMKTFSCTCQSWPILPDTTNHDLWKMWDTSAEMCLIHVSKLLKGAPMVDPRNNMQFNLNTETNQQISQSMNDIPSPNLPFFTQQLAAFEIWLDYGGKILNEIPSYLPIVLQVLLSPTHRLRALLLLKRYVAMGPSAINATLLVGIYPYVLRLLQSSASDIRQVLVAIWAHIIGYDVSCKQDIVRDKLHGYFIQFIAMKEYSLCSRCLAMFILSEICNNYPEGQSMCLQQNLHRLCTTLLSNILANMDSNVNGNSFSADTSSFVQWTCFCLSKLCENIWAKYLCITESGYLQLYPLLLNADPIIRITATVTLGEMFGASNVPNNSTANKKTTSNANVPQNSFHPHDRRYSDISISSIESLVDPRELREAEIQLALQLLDSLYDGCVAMRHETAISLSKFVMQPAHLSCLMILTRCFLKLKLIEAYSSSNKFSNDNKNKISIENSDPIPILQKNLVKGVSPLPSPSPSLTSFSPIQSSNNIQLSEAVGDKSSPWNLDNNQIQLFIDEVKTYLESQGVGISPPPSPVAHESHGELDVTKGFNYLRVNENSQVSTVMATAYVKIWLAIYRVQSNDPHIYVARAAFAITQRVNELVQLEDNDNLVPIDSKENKEVDTVLDNIPPSPSSYAPIGLSARQPLTPTRSKAIADTIDSPIIPRNIQINNENLMRRNSLFEEKQQKPILISSFYDWSKQLFQSSEDNIEEISDETSFKTLQISEIYSSVKNLREIYSIMDDSSDIHILDRKTKEEQQMIRSSAIAALPQSLTRFEQKMILNIDNAKMTSLLSFHTFNDILASSDGTNIKLLSTTTGNKLMELRNCHNHNGSLIGNDHQLNNSRITTLQWINESYDTFLMAGSDNGIVNIWRDVTESDPIEINGTGKYRQQSIFSQSVANYETHSGMYVVGSSSNIMLASSFIALPDIAVSTRGSGLISTWIQESGTITAAGNSPTIRVWDVAAEKCSRIFNTGLDTCATAIVSKSTSSSFFSLMDRNENNQDFFPKPLDSNFSSNNLKSWTFAGFADGTVSIFDERTSLSSGKVNSARIDSGSWIVAAYLRHDLPQVITASIKGSVRFWDIRNMRVYKTLEVFKHPLTALAVHSCLPIMATGSHAQIIKIFTMGGDQLDRDIKYHEGFLGQRIGPVSCLAFHPYKLMLASGATDNIISIYSPAIQTNEK